VKPLSVLAAHGDRTAFRGQAIGPLLVGAPKISVDVAESTMGSVSGKKTRSVSVDFGLSILSSVLKGFNLPETGIENKFEGATEVSFSFGDVVRQFVDKGELGLGLKGHHLDPGQPASAIFFGNDPWECLLIDSTIASSDFTINVTKTSSNDFKIDVGAIQAIVDKANVGVKVTNASDLAITFEGAKRLSFAFSCVRLFLAADGRIQVIEEDTVKKQLKGAGGSTLVEVAEPKNVLITPAPAMVEIEALPNP
jgi:hypothetical protein